MKEVVGGNSLPLEIEARIENFEAAKFDVAKAASKFAADPGVKKRKLLELVAAVFDADGEVDFAEDDYMRSLATALGMTEKEYGDLVIEYDVEDVGDIVDVLVSVPPPVPEK
jgi:hypothetical protein